MSNIQKLLEAMQERQKLDAKIFALNQTVKQEMLEQKLDKIDTKAGQLVLKSTAKKRKNKRFEPTTKMAELQSALKAERAELLEANNKQLYALQKQKDMSELRMELLLDNEWTKELEAKLKEAEAEAKTAQAELNEQKRSYIELNVQLAEKDYISLAGDNWISKAITEAKQLKPKKMTRPMVLEFIAQYYKGYYANNTLDEAWQKRVSDHILYWEGRA